MTNRTLKEQALAYHTAPAGKLGITLTKPMNNHHDLSLAYTPGVAEPVKMIAQQPDLAYTYTAKANLVAVISNGSAILGLGNLGPLAAKPVMEGKAVLFKQLAGVDAFDLEIDAKSPDEIIACVQAVAPTFGGINLEDIKAPECFEVEQRLSSLLDIPVFHDDQHGTAVVMCAALLNALDIQNKPIHALKTVILGAGAAGIACKQLMIEMGAQAEQIIMIDRQGVIHQDRSELPPHKAAVAVKTADRSLADAMQSADVFVGLSGPNLVSEAMIMSMADKPIVFAMSNPDPEVDPQQVNARRPDAIMATGRSDYPNQINNVLCFPYIFRGALDAQAKAITTAMKIAAVEAIAGLAKEPVDPSLIDAYPHARDLAFGPRYILPLPTDPRLRERVPAAVMAACSSA